MNQSQLDLLRLHLSPGIGRSVLFKLRHHFGCFSVAAAASGSAWQQAGVAAQLRHTLLDPAAEEFVTCRTKMADLAVRLISFWDADYPALLRTIYDPPALLYLRGRLPQADGFAVVGSRQATASGLSFARDVAKGLAQRNICVISGMARGVDSAAHCGALAAGGTTVAVLGCGVDRIYPPESTRLYREILAQGALLSEHPPGTPPAAGHFPGRNRIISGLARGVLIVEAARGSGSLITAEFALEQGRELFAMPGEVRHPNSHGPHQLLKEGAQLVTEVSDILHALWPDQVACRQRSTPQQDLAAILSGNALAVYRQLQETPVHQDEIARKCALTPMELSAILLDLELRGGVRQLPGGHYVRGLL
ncbi:MAG: DNA-processing protein DprA [Pelovirga sp.]